MELMNIGKYKNQSLENVYNDKNYFKWIMKQEWFINNCVYPFLKDFKPNEPIILNNNTGIILCDDILEMIGNEFKKIKNKPVDKIKYCARCRRCDKIQFCNGINIFGDNHYQDSCGDCNVKDEELQRLEDYTSRKNNKCKCGKHKKSGNDKCYTCFKKSYDPFRSSFSGYNKRYM